MSARKINMLVPLAGAGRLFEEAGEVFPKPLVEIGGYPMIQVVCDDLACDLDQQFIFVIRQSDEQQFALREVLELIKPDCEIVVVDADTGGAACTALLAVEHIDNDTPLVIANADQHIGGEFRRFINHALNTDVDGSMIVFESIHPKWSFVRCDADGYAVEVAEKRPISRNATAGVYYFKEGSEFVDACKNMIRKDAQVMGQYFICPCYNEMILKGLKIPVFPISKDVVFPFSSPDDVKEFERMQQPRQLRSTNS